ncbi:hypothetical protein KCP74_06640 [Salmonella enterica subsp. enterica]|nr:hypothetical protein KCP74_06640 [Salmonella enterica subsp. enterica]
MRVIARAVDRPSPLTDPAVIRAMHFIRNHACKGIKVEQVLLTRLGFQCSKPRKRFMKKLRDDTCADPRRKAGKRVVC